MSHDEEEKRVIQKFCHKTAPLIDRLTVNPVGEERATGEHVSPIVTTSQSKVYGLIKKEDMEKILNSYELQQDSPRKQDKPIVCDGVVGSSFAKLLFSRVGFHNLGSTDYLVSNLGIRDYNRDSFLGGHSSYSLPKHETLEGIIKNENRYVISNMMKSAYQCIDNQLFAQADELIKKALEIDKHSGDALGARGRYYSIARKDFHSAIEDYNSALRYNPMDIAIIKKNFADALFHIGYKLYAKKSIQEAKQVFENALMMDSEHEGARLHLDLCRNKLHSNSLFPHERANTSYRK